MRDRKEGHNHSDDCVFLSESRRNVFEHQSREYQGQSTKMREVTKASETVARMGAGELAAQPSVKCWPR